MLSKTNVNQISKKISIKSTSLYPMENATNKRKTIVNIFMFFFHDGAWIVTHSNFLQCFEEFILFFAIHFYSIVTNASPTGTVKST